VRQVTPVYVKMEKGKQPPGHTVADSRLLCELGGEEHNPL